MDFNEAFKNAGIVVPPKPEKISRKEETIELKVNSVRDALKYIQKYTVQYNAASDDMGQMMAMDGMATRINEYVQFIIDIMHIIYNSDEDNKEQVKNMSLQWAIRQAKSYLCLSSEEENTIDKLMQRNNVEHEYVNSRYNKQTLMDYVNAVGSFECLVSIVDKIETYIKSNVKELGYSAIELRVSE